MMLQLNPPIPVDTPKGKAFAHITIDYSQEHYLLFVCFLSSNGECWIFPNKDVKLQCNPTMEIRSAIHADSLNMPSTPAIATNSMAGHSNEHPLTNGAAAHPTAKTSVD